MMNYLLDITRNFRIADFFDISLIFILIYVILTWFKKTASRFVFIGISIMGLIYVLARFFLLHLTTFVLQGFFAILLIALVIIFQEDLRRFFERMAMWYFIRKKWSSVSAYQDIDILTEVVTKFTLKKTGALIVIKGNDPLDRHLKSGIHLDGNLSKALLESIFDPHSIGHDGAVVIENGRVFKFGCHLPLSLNITKFGNLGLRHTAALGLVERSDALCIVVSEELGTIRIARDEKLERLDNPDQLKTILEAFYQEKFPVMATKKTWFGWVKENSREKAFAFIMAWGLWLTFVYHAGDVRRDFIVPVEYQNPSPSWIIEELKPKEVMITLTGSTNAFFLLNPMLLKISLDISKLKEGKQEVILGRNQVRHPENLSVFKIEPDKIYITAHHKISVD
ncbi:MAG: diadenylate cyclase [Thermodesulfobacteriota bacterium]|nr:diadenylate cyclase [Thermodesulfobacteriota bacterium]